MSDFVQFPEADYDRAAFSGFDATTGNFSLANAKAMMWFAQLAYEVDTAGNNGTAAKIDRIRQLWGFGPVTTFRGQRVALGASFDTTGVLGERPDAVVLAFAGTDPAVWETVATDFNLRIGPSHVHVGFQAAMDAVAANVDAAVSLSQQSQKPLFIAGHSLGAALGILAARHAVDRQAAPRAVYGYGTPRVGDATFQGEYNNRIAADGIGLGLVTYRLVHGLDIVARVPPAALSALVPGAQVNYVHVGRVLECGTRAKFVAANLSAQEANDPDVTPGYVMRLVQSAALHGVGGILGAFASGHLPTPQEFTAALFRNLPPRGHGPLADWLRLLPAPIREHLQDQYIDALT
jgi:triacylglycerol lipase